MIQNILKLVIVFICIQAVLLLSGACGTSAMSHLEPIISGQLVAQSYLVPGDAASFPTTVRMSLWIRDTALPVSSASIDIDGEGPQQPVIGELRLFGKLVPQAAETMYYFDFAWEGPDDTMSKVTVNTATGTYSEDVILRLDWLAEWPY